jgi:ABC-type antimicrobial peptide transport system permease subunit
MLYGVSADDPISLLVAILVLSVAALLACLLPALHATRIDPIAALRE